MAETNDLEDSEFNRQWANDLAQARTPQEAAMSSSTVQAAVRSWRRFSAGATVLIAEARRRTASSFRTFETAVRDAAPAVGQALLAISQVAAATYAEHLNAECRRADEALRARGWWALSTWDDEELLRYAELARTLDRRALANEICRSYRAYGCRVLRRTVASWWEDPVLRLRRPIVRDALNDHAAGRYRVSIPTLLPCIEGVVADTFGLGKRTRITAGLESLVDIFDGLDALELEVGISTLAGLYSPVDFSTTSGLSTTLNRHLILHGRTVRYGNEPNSLKVFLHMDEVSCQLATKRRLEAGQATRLEHRPISLANDLVKALGVPDEMLEASRTILPLIEARRIETRSAPPPRAPSLDPHSRP